MPWYLAPDVISALLSDHALEHEQDRWGDWNSTIAPSPARDLIWAAYRENAEAERAALGDKPFVTFSPDFLIAAVAGIAPYAWRHAYFWPRVEDAANAVCAAAAERLAA